MNKLLWEKKWDDGRRIISIDFEDEMVVFGFDKGPRFCLKTEHDQDCCEHVYGDFSVFKYHKEELLAKQVRGVSIKAVEGMGFLVCFDSYWEHTKVFVACYNYQNGYYSSDLELQIEADEEPFLLDISGCVEDHID